jgi:biofilm PGA synthesis protein PgaD
MNTRSLIIEKPELQSNVQRYGWSSLTFIFWILYVYLWLPLLTLAAWWIGAKIFNYHMIQLEGYVGLIEKLTLYSSIILVISAILIGWAELNRMRFKNQLRRMDVADVTLSEVAKKYNLHEHQLAQLRQKKSMQVHFSEKGVISGVSEYSTTNTGQ